MYVGEVYTAAHQKKQWVFVTDDSISDSLSEGLSDSLLAISFCSPCIDEDSFAPINSNLVGSMVSCRVSFFFFYSIMELAFESVKILKILG